MPTAGMLRLRRSGIRKPLILGLAEQRDTAMDFRLAMSRLHECAYLANSLRTQMSAGPTTAGDGRGGHGSL